KTFNLHENSTGNSINSNYKINYLRIFQSTYFNKGEVYDLNIGDEYHFYLYDIPSYLPPGHKKYNHLVLNKTTSTNNDTITLTISERREIKTGTVNYSTNPPT